MPKRPLLVWFTQLLVLFLAAVFALFLTSVGVAFQQLSAKGVAMRSILIEVGVHVVLLVFFVALFIGQVRRSRWAWAGSVLFAAGVVGLVIRYRFWPSGEPMPILPMIPSPPGGPGPADIVVAVLLLVYPLRLFFSRDVRQFFGVDRQGEH